MVGAHVVRDLQIGLTSMKFADNAYREKTASDIERILQRIAEQAQRQFVAAASIGKYEQENTDLPARHCDGAGGAGFCDGGSVLNCRRGRTGSRQTAAGPEASRAGPTHSDSDGTTGEYE